jgi:hypothetical protein
MRWLGSGGFAQDVQSRQRALGNERCSAASRARRAASRLEGVAGIRERQLAPRMPWMTVSQLKNTTK